MQHRRAFLEWQPCHSFAEMFAPWGTLASLSSLVGVCADLLLAYLEWQKTWSYSWCWVGMQQSSGILVAPSEHQCLLVMEDQIYQRYLSRFVVYKFATQISPLLNYLICPPISFDHCNIEINITNNHHFALAYLLGITRPTITWPPAQEPSIILNIFDINHSQLILPGSGQPKTRPGREGAPRRVWSGPFRWFRTDARTHKQTNKHCPLYSRLEKLVTYIALPWTIKVHDSNYWAM